MNGKPKMAKPSINHNKSNIPNWGKRLTSLVESSASTATLWIQKPNRAKQKSWIWMHPLGMTNWILLFYGAKKKTYPEIISRERNENRFGRHPCNWHGRIPEGLPIVGHYWRLPMKCLLMAKRNANFVKKLSSLETLVARVVILTDKQEP